MLEIFDMGKNSGFIWSAYGIALVVFIIIGLTTRARRVRTERALRGLRAPSKSESTA